MAQGGDNQDVIRGAIKRAVADLVELIQSVPREEGRREQAARDACYEILADVGVDDMCGCPLCQG